MRLVEGLTENKYLYHAQRYWNRARIETVFYLGGGGMARSPLHEEQSQSSTIDLVSPQ
ncbi:MAG: hypothetical protein F6K09_14765 [Merismopedia sp. SIO2A8]|nr:hypothetical protein [Symploca sp. SIO2B6]NET49945.1 hypothetical protein [Merismopedia sp. SIO2A8]